MHPKRAYKLTVLLFVLICLGTAAALVLFRLRANINYFYTPAEIVRTEPIGKNLRLGGYVKKNSVTRLEDGRVGFVLTDGEEEVRVVYAGLLPNLFAEEEEAVVNGRLQTSGTLIAKQVLAKHDENYRPPETKYLNKNKPGDLPQTND